MKPSFPVRTLSDLIEFNVRHKDKALKYGQARLVQAARTGELSDTQYLKARLRDLRLSRCEGIDQVMAEHDLDVLLFAGNSGADIAARAGYPSLIVPGGYDEKGRPLGITFTARAFEEPRLFELGYAYERATGHRELPGLDERDGSRGNDT